MNQEYASLQEFIRVLTSLTDVTRLRLLRLLLGHEELCVCELVDALQIPQYKVSRHLRGLRTVGLVEARRSGRWMHYRIAGPARSKRFHKDLLQLLGKYLDGIPESKRDDTCLSRRLAMRRSGECVVGRAER